MKRTQLLSTAAALLLLGAGAAHAQVPAPSRDQTPAQPAPAAQQNAPAEKMAPPLQSQPSTSGQAPRAADPARDQKAQSGARPDNMANPNGKADMKQMPPAAETKGAADTNKSAGSGAMDTKTPDAAKASDANKASDVNKTATPAGAERSTTGQGAGAAARLSTEQRSKITTVIRQQNVQKVEPTTLNISLSIGARVPSTVRYYPLPQEVVVIYPEWRGYHYILVGDQIVILDPSTHEIVAILEA